MIRSFAGVQMFYLRLNLTYLQLLELTKYLQAKDLHGEILEEEK